MTAPARRAIAFIAVIFMFLVGVVAPVHAQTERDPDDPNVRLTLVSQSDYARPDEDLVLRLRVEGARPSDRLRFMVWQAVDRNELRAVRDATAETTLSDEDLVRLYSSTLSEPYEQLVDPTTGIVTITIPAHRATSNAGVYPVTISIRRGRDFLEPLLTTTLIRLGQVDPLGGPLDAAVIIPLRATVSHQLDGTVAIDPAERQRLVDLLDLASRHPTMTFSYEPAPETLDALSQGTADDRALLERIGSATRSGTRLSSPYVHVDEEAMRAAGLELTVADLHDEGAQTLSTLVGEVDPSIARLDPTDTPDTLTLRRNLGARWLLVDDRWLEPLDPDLFPPTMLQSFVIEDSRDTPIRALSIDGSLALLTDQLDDPFFEADRPRLLQQVIADLVAGHGDDPDLARGTVVALPHDFDPRVARAEDLLATLAGLPQLRFVGLSDVIDVVSPASPGGNGRIETAQSGPLERSLRSEEPVDLSDFARGFQQTSRHLRGLRSISAVATSQPVPLDQLLWTSTDDRLSDEQRRDVLGAVDDLITARLNPDGQPAFAGPGSQRVTMTSRGATIPIQIDNRLGVDATVRIELRSEKLTFPNGAQLATQALAPGPNTVEVEVEAKVSGDSILEVTVLPPDPESGLGTLSTGTFTVRATALSGVGLVLSIVAVLVLCVWWARHVRRTRRARANAAAEPADHAATDPVEETSATTTDPPLTRTET